MIRESLTWPRHMPHDGDNDKNITSCLMQSAASAASLNIDADKLDSQLCEAQRTLNDF